MKQIYFEDFNNNFEIILKHFKNKQLNINSIENLLSNNEKNIKHLEYEELNYIEKNNLQELINKQKNLKKEFTRLTGKYHKQDNDLKKKYGNKKYNELIEDINILDNAKYNMKDNDNRLLMIDNQIELENQKINRLSNRVKIMNQELVLSNDQMIQIQKGNKRNEKIYYGSFYIIGITIIIILISKIIRFLINYF